MPQAQILQVGDATVDEDPSDTRLGRGTRDALQALSHDGLDDDRGGPRFEGPVDRAIEVLDLDDRAVFREDHFRLEAGARGSRAGVVGLQPLKLLVVGQERDQ
jgi:hypothetical protein